ncbi:MAG: ferritin-like domain-containing protein [bacterium]|nr:ferritin-like domain-containing protein [bacterium]MDY2830797.1 ferritin-like domain-containing protein [Alphaproteobacteria bacterium]
MGQMAQKISAVDKEELLKILNVAYAEEWLAYYQYWIGAQVAVGPMRKAIAAEFMEHAHEELEHAEKVSKRIIELGGTPILDPRDWEETALCKYDAPEKPYVVNLLEQNLVAERCAIVRYQKICEMTFGKDFVTYKMAAEILEDEVEHEEEIGAYREDIEMTFAHKDEVQK